MSSLLLFPQLQFTLDDHKDETRLVAQDLPLPCQLAHREESEQQRVLTSPNI